MKVVAVSGLHRGENPQPGAAVIASLRRRFPEVRLVGLSYDPLESGLYGLGHDRPDSAYLIPYPGVGAKAVMQRLNEILDHEKIDYIIPCLDSEISNFSTIEPDLNKRGVQCLLPSKESFEKRHKPNLSDFCRDIDIPVPKTQVVHDIWALDKYANEIEYPVYTKGKFYEAQQVYSKPSLLEASTEIARVWGWPILVQEVVVGEEYDVTGLGDGEGGIVQFCAIRKMLRSKAGKGFAGIVVENSILEEMSRKIIAALRWNGPFELEFIKTPGRPYMLFEINPRFPAWIDFPTQIGCNMPARMLERLMGMENPAPLPRCSAGQMFIRHAIDIVGNIEDLAKMARSGERVDPPGNDEKVEVENG